jgi:hypothetical protein
MAGPFRVWAVPPDESALRFRYVKAGSERTLTHRKYRRTAWTVLNPSAPDYYYFYRFNSASQPRENAGCPTVRAMPQLLTLTEIRIVSS